MGGSSPHADLATASSTPAADALALASFTPVAPRPSLALRSDWPAAIRPRIDWSSLYDDRAEWSRYRSGFDTTPPWGRRLGALSNYRTDPYER